MTFIAYNHNNIIISIVVARSKELAMAYWQGSIGIPTYVRCVEDQSEFEPLENHTTGVFPILKTKVKTLSAFASNPVDYIVVDK